jgi:hypothetical protein
MKRKNIILGLLIVFSFGMFSIQSCKKEDPTTFEVKQAFTTPVVTSPAVRGDGTIYTPNNTVTLTWESVNAGDPGKWNVYFGEAGAASLVVEGSTALSYTANGLKDGTSYEWYVEIVDARKVKTTSAVNSFVAVDGTNPSISIALDVATDVKSAVGLDLPADDVVDLRFLLVNKSDGNVVVVVDDGYASEVFDTLGRMPDGEYMIGVDVGATINAGDFNAPITLSMSLSFDQLGILSSTLDFPSVMTNEKTCAYYRTYLASVKKVGATYTVTKSVADWVDPSVSDPAVLAGTWLGTDGDATYASEIVSAVSDGVVLFDKINSQWMQTFWGEVILTSFPVEFVYNYCTGTFTIPKQKIMETSYEGEAQPFYSIVGTGTFDSSGDFPVITIKYELVQGTTNIAAYCFSKGYMTVNYFEAVITTDPSAGGAKKMFAFPANIQLIKPAK